MDFAALRSSIFEGEDDDAVVETPIKDQLSRPLVGFPILMGIGSLSCGLLTSIHKMENYWPLKENTITDLS